jgi:hypothetical protein
LRPAHRKQGIAQTTAGRCFVERVQLDHKSGHRGQAPAESVQQTLCKILAVGRTKTTHVSLARTGPFHGANAACVWLWEILPSHLNVLDASRNQMVSRAASIVPSQLATKVGTGHNAIHFRGHGTCLRASRAYTPGKLAATATVKCCWFSSQVTGMVTANITIRMATWITCCRPPWKYASFAPCPTT